MNTNIKDTISKLKEGVFPADKKEPLTLEMFLTFTSEIEKGTGFNLFTTSGYPF